MRSIRSVVWIGRGESFAAEVAAEYPSLDVVWECDAQRALDLPLADFDAMVLASDDPEAALGELDVLSDHRPLPPILVRLDTEVTSGRAALMARGAADVLGRESTRRSGPANRALLERLEALSASKASPGRSHKDTAAATGRALEIIGTSAPMREVFALVGHASRSRVTALLTGETGTGKELLARAIHEKSARRRRAFVAVNCAAFPDTLLESELFGHKRGAFTGADSDKAGLFEAADRGTLFLDEVGETSGPFQAKLLRVLQEREVRAIGGSRAKPVDVRVVAATNRDLRREAAEGRFRSDLYYRLAVFPIHVPPLRDRPADISPLAQHFLALHGGRTRRALPALSQEATDLLRSYRWPGNVRELENELQRALAIATPGEELTPSHFSERLSGALEPVKAVVQPGETLRETLSRIETWLIRRALAGNSGRRAATARQLGITREGLYKKMQRLGIE